MTTVGVAHNLTNHTSLKTGTNQGVKSKGQSN